jgi:hypothetical protein
MCQQCSTGEVQQLWSHYAGYIAPELELFEALKMKTLNTLFWITSFKAELICCLSSGISFGYIWL